jgi:hypothetical protein
MAITSISRDTNNNVSLVRMITTDNLATVAGTNYIKNNQNAINELNGGVWGWFISDMILCAAADGNAFFYFTDSTFATLSIYGEQGHGVINPGLINQLAYYSMNGSTLSGLATANNGVLVTSNAGVPSISSTLPSAVQANITTVGTIATGVWNGTPVVVQYGGTGLATMTAYAVLCGGTTSTGNLQQVSGVGTSGQILTSNGAAALPTWQTNAASGTVNSGTINDLAYYAATGTAVSGLATANNGVLITSGLGVPSISSTLPSAVQSNITALGTIATGVWNGSLIGLAYGGTAANLTAVNGGIVYSTASALAISAAGSSGQILTSAGAATPVWTTATFPATAGSAGTILRSNGTNWVNSTSTFADTYAINTLLYASGANTVTGLATATTAVLTTSSGVPTWASELSLALGGTNAALTASNGGIFYSTASAGAILAGTATAGLALLSGSSTTPSWSSSPPVTRVIVQTFTSSGTYTPTSGMKYCIIECIGPGGGGGGVALSSGTGSGGGGGAGAYSKKTSTAATVGSSQTVTVGTGGGGGSAGNNPGSAGSGATSVGAICTAGAGSGGGGAAANSFGAGGGGGAAGTGDMSSAGNGGGTGMGGTLNTTNILAGVGAGGPFGGQPASQSIGVTAGGTGGNNGNGYGAGGNGGGSGNSSAAAAGGNGSAGFVIITEFVSV